MGTGMNPYEIAQATLNRQRSIDRLQATADQVRYVGMIQYLDMDEYRSNITKKANELLSVLETVIDGLKQAHHDMLKELMREEAKKGPLGP